MREKILVISLNRFGDNLQVTPIFRVLKEKYPTSEITVLSESGFHQIFTGNPYIDNLKLFHRENFNSEYFVSLDNLRDNLDAELYDVINSSYDLLINRQSSMEAAAIAGLVDAKEKKGLFLTKNNTYTVWDPWTRLLFAMVNYRKHNPFTLVEYNIKIAGGEESSLYIQSKRENISQLLEKLNIKNDEKFVVIQPGASTVLRQWMPNNFVVLIRKLLMEYPDVKIMLTGSVGDKKLLDSIGSEIKDFRNRLFVEHTLDFKELAALLSFCDLFITNDTGPMHVAEAVKCKILCLYFSGSLFNETAPYGEGNVVVQADLDCLPCEDSSKCPNGNKCVSVISPEVVFELASYELGEKNFVDKSKIKGVMVYQSEKDGKDIKYLPLSKPILGYDVLMRILYSITFRIYISAEEISLNDIVNNLKRDYSNVTDAINSSFDVYPEIIDNFSRTSEEAGRIKKIMLDCITGIRELL